MLGFWGIAALGLATGLLAFGLLIRSLFVRTRHRSLVLDEAGDKGKGGAVRITENSIVSCVESSLARYRDILDVEVKPSLFKGRQGQAIALRVKAGIPDHGAMSYLTSSVQETLKRDVEAYTGLPVEKVDVLFDAIESDLPPRQDVETEPPQPAASDAPPAAAEPGLDDTAAPTQDLADPDLGQGQAPSPSRQGGE